MEYFQAGNKRRMKGVQRTSRSGSDGSPLYRQMTGYSPPVENMFCFRCLGRSSGTARVPLTIPSFRATVPVESGN